jgi:hypothetical protein
MHVQSEEVVERIDNQNIDGWEEDSVKAALSVHLLAPTPHSHTRRLETGLPFHVCDA